MPPSSDDNYAVSWSREYTPDYLFILQVFIVTGEGEVEGPERQGQSEGGGGGDGASERGYA